MHINQLRQMHHFVMETQTAGVLTLLVTVASKQWSFSTLHFN